MPHLSIAMDGLRSLCLDWARGECTKPKKAGKEKFLFHAVDATKPFAKSARRKTSPSNCARPSSASMMAPSGHAGPLGAVRSAIDGSDEARERPTIDLHPASHQPTSEILLARINTYELRSRHSVHLGSAQNVECASSGSETHEPLSARRLPRRIPRRSGLNAGLLRPDSCRLGV